MSKVKPFLFVLVIVLLAVGGYTVQKYFFSAGTVNQLQASGTIEARTVNLTAKSAGTVTNLTVKEGDAIQQGQQVAVLERNDLVAQHERDAANLLTAQDNLRDLEAGSRQQNITAAQAQVDLDKIKLAKAKKDLERYTKLYAAGGISRSALEDAQNNVQVLEQTIKGAQAQLDLLQSGNRENQIAAASDTVKSLQAVSQASQAVLNDLKIVSPLAGVVTSKNYENGEYVTAGSALLTVSNLDDMWIKVYIPTPDLPSVKLQQHVQVTVTGSSQVFSGQVSEISSQGEYTPKAIQTKDERVNVVYAVVITINNEQGVLKPGMPADVVFDRS